MVVFALGSDSGFGIGADGIIDDYDDESGISVILWCIIFVFLLVVTIWFYITQLMPARSTKCDPNDEDEEERVANRLFDHLGAKDVSKHYKESPSVEPSTSNENTVTDNYEVIDGEIRIHYTNYERQAEINVNSNEAGPREASDTILRRPSMEEMSLIFPGFLPSISEEDEEELDKSVEQNCKEIEHKDKSNANTFVEYEDSNVNNSFDPNEQREGQYGEYNGDVRVKSNRKGKQPAEKYSSELRRRTCHYDDTEHIKTTTKEMSNTRDNEAVTAVYREEYVADDISVSHESHNKSQQRQNMELSNTCISGSEINCDPKVQNNDSNTTRRDPLIIGKNKIVTQGTLSSSDANENVIELNLKRTDAILAQAESKFAVKNDVDEDLVCLEKSSEIVQEFKADVLEKEEDQNGNIEKLRSGCDQNGLILSHSAVTKCSTNMTKQLTHAWTFYAMSEHTSAFNANIKATTNRLDNCDQQLAVPEIVVDLYKENKCDDMNGSADHKILWSRTKDIEDTFETDIDIDDVDLDELDVSDSTEGQLNCFFKRHVSVTDLDKILSASEFPNDETKQCQDETIINLDQEDTDHEVTVPLGKANNRFNTERDCENKNTTSMGGPKALNHPPVDSQREIKRQFVFTQNHYGEHDLDNSESGTTGKHIDHNEIKIAQIVQLANSPPNSNAENIVDSAACKTEDEECNHKSKLLPNRDFLRSSVDNYNLKQLNQVENIINNNTKMTEDEFKCGENILPITKKKILEIELQKGGNTVKTADQGDQPCMTSRVADKTSKIETANLTFSNLENNEEKNQSFDTSIVLNNNKKQVNNNNRSIYKPTKKDSLERKAGFTAAELSGKIDLSQPASSISKDEVIIGRRKLKKDSISTSKTKVTSRITENTAVAIATEEKSGPPIVTQYSGTKEPQIKMETFETNRINLFEEKTVNTKEIGMTEKIMGLQDRRGQHYVDLPSKRHIKKRTVQPSIEKSVKLTPKKSELQTLITIKDIPDSNIGVKVCTSNRLDLTKSRKTSTGLEKAEQIVKNRLKRLEDEKRNYTFTNDVKDNIVKENVSCTTSSSREINWNEFFVDGNLLDEVKPCENATDKCIDFDNDDIQLMPSSQASKPVSLKNKTEINEYFISETMSPREIDWKWCDEKLSADPEIDTTISFNEKDDINNKSNSSSYRKSSHKPLSNRNEKEMETDSVENSVRKSSENSCTMFGNTAKEETDKEEANCEQIAVGVTDSVIKGNNSKSNENQSAGGLVNHLHAAIKASQEDFNLVDDVFDNESEVSLPSGEPEFPVRLTKSFSELRTAVSMNRVNIDDFQFPESKPDRSKSQTDVFKQQDSQDEVLTEAATEQVFKTTITVDEVYANKRRIVILNVRKKSPGKNRWKSLSDLESTSRKHVFRFKSTGSHSDETHQTAGKDTAVLKTKENTKETMSAVSESISGLHDNEAIPQTSPTLTSNRISHPPTSKKAINQNMDETNGDISPLSWIKQENNDNNDKTFQGTNIEHSSIEGVIPSKVNMQRSHNIYSRAHKGKDEKSAAPCHTMETSDALQNELTYHNNNLAVEHDNPTKMVSASIHSPTSIIDNSTSLPMQFASPVDGSIDQKSTVVSQRRSSGTMFAVNRHSPTPFAESPTESPRHDLALSSIGDTRNQETSITFIPSSGTMYAVSRHSPTPLTDSRDERYFSKPVSLSPVEDLPKQESVPSSGTMFVVSRHSPTPIMNPPINESVISETLTSREIDWEWLERNILKENEPLKNTSTSEPRIQNKSIPEDDETVEIVSTENCAKQRQIPHSSGVSSMSISSKSRVSPSLLMSSNQKCEDHKALLRQSSLSPELKISNQSSSRCSSTSSGSLYSTSRVSPIDRDKHLQPSPELIPVAGNSRRSSASSGSVFAAIRVSPTPSVESEFSNAEEKGPQMKSSSKRRSQRGSYRSGTVFAVSGYSSAASDVESQRPNSTSPSDEPAKRLEKEEKAVSRDTKKPENEKREISPAFKRKPEINSETSRIKEQRGNDLSSEKTFPESFAQEKTGPTSSVTPPTDSEAEDYLITNDGWLEKVTESEPLRKVVKSNRPVMVTDLDSLLDLTNSKVAQDTNSELYTFDEVSTVTSKEERTSHRTIKVHSVGSTVVLNNREKDLSTKIPLVSGSAQETDLDSNENINSQDFGQGTFHSRNTSRVVKTETHQRSIIRVTSSNIGDVPVLIRPRDASVSRAPPCDENPVFDDLDDEVFTNILKTTVPRRSEASYSSDADSETSSLNSVPLKPKSRHNRASLEAQRRTTPPKLMSRSSDSSSVTPITTEKDDQELNSFFPLNTTSTPKEDKPKAINRMANSMSRETTTEPGHIERHVNAEGIDLLKDSSYGASQPKTRSYSESHKISTEIEKSAFTPVRSRNKERRSISQENILDGISTAEPMTSPKTSPSKTSNHNVVEGPTFKEMADSHKSMPDLHNVHEENDMDIESPTKVPYHSRLSTHTRLWLSQTAGIDTSDLCKDESGGSEIFLFPSNRFQPGTNVDASFLSLASETEDIPDDVSTRPSSPMSEFSFAGETPFGGEYKDELNIISCGHNYCGNEEVLRGQEKTSFTSCPSCYTYYCSRECRQAHWREHKKFCHFGRINSYMRSFIYFCHKKENLKLLLSKIATKNFPSKGRGCVMVTFASPKQARKFMTSGCVLLPSPPSYSPLQNLMREGVVSKHKVNLVQQVKDYDPTHEFVLNLAIVAGRLEDLPRHPVPRHKLNTVLQCIKIPLSDSLTKSTTLDTSQETRLFYLPKCSRHEFINDMEARRHYCRNISKGLKQYGIRLKKDYPEAYDSLCMYVEKNLPFKPLTVYGNQNSKIVACKIMPEGSSSAV